MSIEDLTKGDTVVKETATPTVSSRGDQSRSWSAGGSLECTVQTMSARDAEKYAAGGSSFFYSVFFSANPSLTRNNRLRWTVRAGVSLSPPIYLKVLDCYPEGPPGEDQLWVADCSQETTDSPA